MNQSTLQDFQSSGVECPKCDYSSDSYKGLGSHWRHNHDGIPLWKRTKCDFCGDVFSRAEGNKTDSENEFCSQECYHAWNRETGARSGENNALWKPELTFTCEQCGDEYGRPECHAEFTRFCSRECQSEYLSSVTGPDHWHWSGGADYYAAIRSCLGPTGWHTLRKEHLESECEMCGAETSPNERDLSLHHIVPILSGGTNGGYNFMTLCEPCHSTVESYCSDLPGFDRCLVE